MPQQITALLLPLLSVIAGFFGSLYIDNIPQVWQEVLVWLPMILAGVAVMMAWHFNKGRVLLVVALFIIPVCDISTLGDLKNLSSFVTVIVFNAALFSYLTERGFFNRFAINRIALLAMQLLWCYALYTDWVSINHMTGHLASTASLNLPLIIMLAILSLSLLFIVSKWWREADFFCACILSSLLVVIILNTVMLTAIQQNILLSSVFLLWCLYLLVDSHKMAYIDDLTQLPGRRALNERLVSLSKNYAIAMLDVDHFKKFNDTYGHDMGDIVLKRVAKNVAKVTNGGRGFRYGGEEFAIVFANRTKKDIQEALEQVRTTIENEVIRLTQANKSKSTNVSVTISIGAAFSKPNRKAEDVIKVADDHLYKAKKAGRNKVMMEARGGR
ncbi:GGDEF domain-containing protein [Marinomonas agarivorans]|nr:GGDEF domain-containing protein [Marinomonas agarivorans]